MESMIYLGYDGMEQAVFAEHMGEFIKIKDRDNPRISEVIDGLCAVSERIEPEKPITEGNVSVVIREIWTHRVEYSDQAWADLLEIGELVTE
jgi:hypothetical protein